MVSHDNPLRERRPQLGWPLACEIFNVGGESQGDPLQHFDAGVPSPPFDTTQICLVYLRSVGEVLLGEPARAPQFLKVESHSLPHIHAARTRDCTELAHRL